MQIFEWKQFKKGFWVFFESRRSLFYFFASISELQSDLRLAVYFHVSSYVHAVFMEETQLALQIRLPYEEIQVVSLPKR